MIEARDLALVTPIDAGVADVRIVIDPAPPEVDPRIAEATERRWGELIGENPRHFDGAILAIERFDPETGTVHARRERYKRLAVQPHVDTGVRILSVTGVVTALDDADRVCALLGRRSPTTRIYGGLWELGPSGGIDPAGEDVLRLGMDHVRRQLADELREELGLELDVSGARAIALSVDAPGNSIDIVVRLDTGRATSDLPLDEAHADAWEYTDVRWIAFADARRVAVHEAATLIPPTRALLAWLGANGQENQP